MPSRRSLTNASATFTDQQNPCSEQVWPASDSPFLEVSIPLMPHWLDRIIREQADYYSSPGHSVTLVARDSELLVQSKPKNQVSGTHKRSTFKSYIQKVTNTGS